MVIGWAGQRLGKRWGNGDPTSLQGRLASLKAMAVRMCGDGAGRVGVLDWAPLGNP